MNQSDAHAKPSAKSLIVSQLRSLQLPHPPPRFQQPRRPQTRRRLPHFTRHSNLPGPQYADAVLLAALMHTVHPGVGHPHVWQGTFQTTVAVQPAVSVLRTLDRPTGMKVWVSPGGHVANSAGHAMGISGHSSLAEAGSMQMSGQAWPRLADVVGSGSGHAPRVVVTTGLSVV
jgi:hypothetical protein